MHATMATDAAMILIEQEREEHKQEIQKLYQLNCICQIHGTANNGTCPECLAEQYQELVDAAVLLSQVMDDRWNHVNCRHSGKKITDAQLVIKSFIKPPPSIADKLDALADKLQNRVTEADAIKELADRYRELHGEGRDGTV